MFFKYKIFLTGFLFYLLIVGYPYKIYSSVKYTGYYNFADTIKERKVVQQPVYNTTRLTTPKPVIDGQLNDECWKTGTWAGDFRQFIPNEGARPSQPTEFKILYDDKNIYVAIRAYDSLPDKIQRYAGLRDEFIGDMVGITFDSYHDHRTGFEFDLSAYGQKIDLVLTNPMLTDFSWNPVWSGKVGFEDSAWIAEMEIPLSQLRYSREEEQIWGLHIWRWIGRKQEESDWEIQTLTGPGVLYYFGELRGIKGLKKSQRLEIMPYGLGKLSTFPKEPGNPFTGSGKLWNGTVGLDAKIGLTSNFTVDLTVNPDFGQVESDPSVMNLTAFEIFYQEKRPFFLEGKTIFDYEFDDLNLFYSRRIGHSPSYIIPPNDSLFVKAPDQTTIISAVKVSGKTSDGLSIGLLQSFTGPEKAKLSDADGHKSSQVVEPFTNYMVARIQKDYNAGTTVVGGMLTSTNRIIQDKNLEFLSRNAYTGGLDLLHQWKDKKYFIDGRLVGSYVNGETRAIRELQESSARYYQRPGADYLGYDTTRTQLDGVGGRFRIGKGGGGLWRYSAGISWLSPGLEINDIGYMQSTDIIRELNNISYFVNHPVSIFRTYAFNLEQFNSWNFGNKYLGSGFHLSGQAEFLNKWSLQLNLIYHSQSLDTRILRGGYDMIIPYNIESFGQIRTDNTKRLIFDIEYQYQYTGQNSANIYQLGPGLTYRPVNTLRIGLSANYTNNFDRLQYVDTKNLSSGDRYIMGTINQQTMGFTFRADYSITPQFSIQYYGSPFVSRGVYSEFKYVTDPLSKKYEGRFSIYQNPVLSQGVYWLDENGDTLPDYSIDNPDFNFHQFRSNFVAKWEYRPGSLIYFVWSSERTGNANPVSSGIGDSFNQLRDVFPGNIFLVKFSYWFSL